MGHARALINIQEPETQIMVYRQVVKYDFSVRKTEEIVRKIGSDDGEGTPVKKTTPFPDEYRDLKNHLNKHFNTGVIFKINELGKGKIEIPFSDPKDLERIIGIFDKLNP
jgi:ParB family chromosome partitioning protein